MTATELKKMTEEEREKFLKHAWQDGDDLYTGNSSYDDVKQDALNFTNHSCDPNAWFVTDIHMAARRDILPGEDILLDYATCETVFQAFDGACLCGSPKCRGLILADDWKRSDLRRAYTNHWRLFILDKMDRETKEHNQEISRIAAVAEGKAGGPAPEPEGKTTDGDENERLIELTPQTFGVGRFFSLHSSLELRGSKAEGRGLFATRFLPKGTVVWHHLGDTDNVYRWVDSADEYKSDPAMQSAVVNFWEEDPDNHRHRGPLSVECIERDASNFWNHSCDPNCWFIDDDKIALSRDVHAGEELFYDYATCKPLLSMPFDCRCGAACCRGRVTTEDWKLPSLRAKYGQHWVSRYKRLVDAESIPTAKLES